MGEWDDSIGIIDHSLISYQAPVRFLNSFFEWILRLLGFEIVFFAPRIDFLRQPQLVPQPYWLTTLNCPLVCSLIAMEHVPSIDDLNVTYKDCDVP